VREELYTVRGPKTMPEMTDAEVRDALDAGADTVVVGVGSVESHGGHIPLGCDTFQVTEFTRRTVAKLTDRGFRAVAGPIVPFGMSSYYRDVPGTCSLSGPTLKAVIKEICLGLHHQGFQKIALILGHGGDYFPMMEAAQEIVDETKAQVMALNWVLAMQARVAEFSESKGPDGHGGEINTSNMMAVIPELVQMDRVPEAHFPMVTADMAPSSQVIGEGRIDEEALPPFAYSPLIGGGVFIPIKDYWNEAGGSPIVGDPSLATPQKGEVCIEIITDWLADVIAVNWAS
jgi:creatinine amidohydrolase